MNEKEFIEAVEDFERIHCQEYMDSHEITYDLEDPDDYTAILKVTDYYGNKWEVPLSVFRGELIISLDGDDSGLDADMGWFFAYIWHELSIKNKALHTSIDTLAKQYESQGQPAVARDIRGLGE